MFLLPSSRLFKETVNAGDDKEMEMKERTKEREREKKKQERKQLSKSTNHYWPPFLCPLPPCIFIKIAEKLTSPGKIVGVNVTTGDLRETVLQLTGSWGADVIFECSGNAKAASAAPLVWHWAALVFMLLSWAWLDASHVAYFWPYPTFLSPLSFFPSLFSACMPGGSRSLCRLPCPPPPARRGPHAGARAAHWIHFPLRTCVSQSHCSVGERRNRSETCHHESLQVREMEEATTGEGVGSPFVSPFLFLFLILFHHHRGFLDSWTDLRMQLKLLTSWSIHLPRL